MDTQHKVLGIYADFKGYSICVIGGIFSEKVYCLYDEKFGKSCSVEVIKNTVTELKQNFDIAKIHLNQNDSLLRELRKNNKIVFNPQLNISEDVFNLAGLVEEKRLIVKGEFEESFSKELDNFDIDVINHRVYAVMTVLKNFYAMPQKPIQSTSFWVGR